MTIVVLLILASVSISTVLGNNGIIPRANEAKFKTDLANIQEEFNLYIMDKTAENGDFSVGSLNASSDLLTYNTQPEEEKGTGNISSVLKSFTAQKYIQSKSFSIIKGDLIYASQNAKELEWAQEVGLAINPYNIDENGVLLSSETNLMLLDKTTGTLVIPEMVTSIGEGTFGLVEGVRRVIIPPTVKEIRKNAFANCTSIEEVVFQTKIENGIEIGIEKIRDYAFLNCKNLKSIELPDTVTEMGYTVFCGNTKLTNVVLSKNIKVLRSNLFGDCRTLKNITIPDGITIIGTQAFRNCRELESINIPASVHTIEGGCFEFCGKLKYIDLDAANKNFQFSENILFNENKTKMLYILSNAIENGQTVFEIPNTVTTLDLGTISHLSTLNKVIIPASVNNIADFRFFNGRITEVEIDEGNNTYMSDGNAIYSKNKTTLYMYYKNLNSIQVDEDVTTIGGYAFYNCSNLRNLRIGKNVTSLTLDWRWDSLKNNMTSLNIDEDNKKYTVKGNAVYFKDEVGNLNTLVSVWGNITELEIPNGVKKISYGALRVTNITRLILPDTIESIGEEAFVSSKLVEIRIPKSVKSIGNNAFHRCLNLTRIEIDNKKGSIPGAAWGCPIGERAIIWLQK